MSLSKYLEKTRRRYSKSINKYGGSFRGLEWGSLKSQQLRFFEASRVINNLNRERLSILDVGCGFGDFFSHLSKYHKKSFLYKGIDITPETINIAKRKQGHYRNAEFSSESLFSIRKHFDCIFLIDILDTPSKGNWVILKKILKKSFKLTKHSLVFSCLSSYSEKKDRNRFYVEPEQLFKFCKKLTPWVDMRHAHLEHNVLVFLFKKKDKRHFNERGRE